MGGELLTRCDELWVMGSAIFSGMREEMELAKKLYMPIFYVSDEMVQDKVKSVSKTASWDWMTAWRAAIRAAMRDRFLF